MVDRNLTDVFQDYITASTRSKHQENSSIIVTSACMITTKSILLILGYAIVFTIGVCGNVIVLISFRHYWRRGPIIELLILYLALFNFLSSMLDPFIFGYFILTCYKSWHFGWFACKLVPPLCRIFTNISIALILIMSIDRCRVIVFPLRRKLSRNRIHLLVLAAVFIGLISEVHHINGSFIGKNGLCQVVYVFVPTYLYPASIIISLRILLIVFVLFFSTLLAHLKLKNASEEKLLQNNNRISSSLNNRCKRVTIMLVVMAAVFSITVLPRDIYHLIYIISWADNDGLLYTEKLKTVNSLLKLLQTSNVIYNVFIYARMHETFRKRKTKCLSVGGMMPRIFSRRRNKAIQKNEEERLSTPL